MNGDRWARNWLPAASVTIGVALIAGPLLAIVLRSLVARNGDTSYVSFDNFLNLFADPRFGGAMANTLIAGSATTALSLLLGFALAFLVARTDMPGRRWLATANFVPFFLSPYVGAISWVYLLAPHGGLLPTWARISHGISANWLNIYSVPGIIFVLTLFYTPYVTLLLTPSLRDMDASFEDLARAHGATFWHTIQRVTLPMLLPELTAAALIVFVTSAGLFDVPAALAAPRGIRFAPTEIYAMVREPSGLGKAAAFCLVVLTIPGALSLWRHRFLAGRRFGAIRRRSGQPNLIRLRWPGKIAALGLEAAYLAGGTLPPLAALIVVSVSKQWAGRFPWRNATLANFDAILTTPGPIRTAIGNTVILAVLGATAGVALAVAQAYYLTRDNPRHRALAEILLTLPLGVPGIVFGLGFLILLVPTPIQGTLGVILIAYIARFLPFATGNVSLAFQKIDPGLEHTARVSGAGWRQSMTRIVAPTLTPSLVASWLLLFVIFIRELGTTMLLYTSGTGTISVAMVELSESEPGYVAALAVVQLGVLLLAFAIFLISRASLPQRPA